MSHISLLKRALSLLLVCGVLCGLAVFPPAQAAGRQAGSGEWFYSQLSPANQEAYDAIQQQVEKLAQNSTDPSAVSFTPTAGDPTGAAIFAFFRDHPEYFWIDPSKLAWSVSSDNVWSLSPVVTGESFFYEGFDVGTLSDVRDEFNQKVQDIIAGMPGGDLVNQLRYLNNWIAQHNVYNPLGVGASNYSRCAASGILSDNNEDTAPVCYGYATAFKVLLDAAGIPNAYIEGWAYNQNNWPHGEQHAWNYVQVDGTWYAIDPTWDDPKLTTGQARFHYFLVGSQTVTETSLSGKGEFVLNHEVTKSPANNYGLTYPALSPTASDQVVTTGFELIQGGSSTKYDTLEAALSAAQTGGGTVKLWEPVTITQTLTIPDGVTLDLNGQNSTGSSSNPVAISGDISPLLSIAAGFQASIVNSSSFTAISTTSTDVCIQNDGTLDLGTNVKIARGKYMMGSDPLTSPIGGNQPQYASNSYAALSPSTPHLLFVYLVIQPTLSSDPGDYQASGGQTVGDLITGMGGSMPSLTVQYYGPTGTALPVPSGSIPPYTWSVGRSPNDGNHVSPGDPLENGDYLFVATVFGYPVTWTVTVSGVPDAPKEYTLTVNGGDGATGGGTYEEGAQVTAAAGTKAGYTFQSWTADGISLTDPSQPIITFIMPGNDVTLTANFVPDAPKQYTVTVNGGDGASGGGTYEAGAQVTAAAGTRAGYTFQGWTAQGISLADPSQPIITFIMPGNDVTLTANFVLDSIPGPDRYTVTVNGGDGASGGGTYETGAQVTVIAGTRAGYTFQGWTAQGISLTVPSQPTVTFVMPGNDVTLTANFVPDAPKQYTVTVNGGDGATGGGTYEEGAQVTAAAGTKAGYTFQSWTADGISLADPSQPTVTFAMPGNDVTLTANWTGNNPGGGSTGGGGTGGGSSSDGSHSTPSGTTQKNPDGSTTTTVTRPNGSTTATTQFPDGSQEVVETRKDGTVTTTTTDAAGNKAEVVQNTDGSSQTTVDSKDGSSSVTVVDEHGTVVSKASLSKANVESAQAAGEAAALPIPGVPVTADREKAPTVTVDLPTGGAVKVEIPVEDVTPGTVAVLVKADGTEVVIKTSLTTEQGVAVTLSAGDTVKIVDNSKTFTDVAASHWGAEGIAFATSRALFTGTSETTFSPDAPMTRGMFVTVLARCADVDTTAGDTWYALGRQWAMEQGISDGSHLDQGLTREQLATMLWRYAGSPVTGADMGGYTDAYRVSGYAQQAMAWAVGQGILTGTTGTTLSPQGEATRAQVATILTRFMEDMA